MSSPSTSPEPPRSDPPRGDLIASWRVDVTSAAWPILIPATILTGVGVLGIGAAFVSHGPFAHNEAITFAGSVCMVSGPLLAIVGMRHLLKMDEYVAALDGGVLVYLSGYERFVAWSDLARVQWQTEPPGLAILPREGEPIVITKPFGMIRGPDLAARLEDLRRKAAFNLPL